MTVRGGGKPRGRGGREYQARRVVDQGWDGYEPPTGEEIEENLELDAHRRRDVERSYRRTRSSGPGTALRFALVALVLGGLVTAGLWFVARPLAVNGVVNWAADNPTALQIPFMADFVRSQLHGDLTEPVDAADRSAVEIVIADGATPSEIADQLAQAGLIKNPRAFVFDAIDKNLTADFKAGRHMVSKSQTVDQILQTLTAQPVTQPMVKITFREGLRIEQMVALLELKEAKPDDPSAVLKLDVDSFYNLAMHPPADLTAGYPWLKIPAGNSLEGFLFPATYEVPTDISPSDFIGMLLDAFVTHAPDGLLRLPPETIYRDVQLASLVETEAKVESDRAMVAGVYANRLDPKLWPTGLLDADPTLNYANDSMWLRTNDIGTWVQYSFWNPIHASGPLSQVQFPDDLAAFNTYHHAGLPPNPICSPSAASLAAAMTPDTAAGYLYFLAKNDGTGTHAFAKTAAEQQANLKKYGYIK